MGRWEDGGISQDKRALSPDLPTSPSPQLLVGACGEIPVLSKDKK
jgi:hypothetical protein